MRIGDYHNNVSDHLPVEIELSLSFSVKSSRRNSRPPDNVIWSKLSPAELGHFSSTMEVALDLISILSCALHGNCLF